MVTVSVHAHLYACVCVRLTVSVLPSSALFRNKNCKVFGDFPREKAQRERARDREAYRTVFQVRRRTGLLEFIKFIIRNTKTAQRETLQVMSAQSIHVYKQREEKTHKHGVENLLTPTIIMQFRSETTNNRLDRAPSLRHQTAKLAIDAPSAQGGRAIRDKNGVTSGWRCGGAEAWRCGGVEACSERLGVPYPAFDSTIDFEDR